MLGETGCGKSTAVREAIYEAPTPKGVVYFLASELIGSFSSRLGSALGFSRDVVDIAALARRFLSGNPDKAMNGNSEEPYATWDVLAPALTKAAALYRKKNGVPMVLVIDAVDLIAKRDPNFLIVLQDFAKASADFGDLRVVFVSSEGKTLPLLMGSSAISRCEIFEVPDLSFEEATSYLIRRGVKESVAGVAVSQIAGGRLILLSSLAKKLMAGKTVADILADLNRRTLGDMERMGIGIESAAFKGDYLNQWTFFETLCRNGFIIDKFAARLLGVDLITMLLVKNIISARSNSTFVIHSQHIKTLLKTLGFGDTS